MLAPLEEAMAVSLGQDTAGSEGGRRAQPMLTAACHCWLTQHIAWLVWKNRLRLLNGGRGQGGRLIIC